MTTLDPRTIAADLMTHAARDLDTLDVLTHIGQAYDVLTYPDSLPAEVLDLVRTAGIDLLWPDGTRDTELGAQRVEVERLQAELAEMRGRIDAAHDTLARLDLDEDSTATLESTVTYLASRWRAMCDAEAEAADEVDRLQAELAEVAAAVAPTVTITPPAAAVRFLHQLHKDWVKTAHEHLAQVDKLTAELAEVRAAALAPGEIETATRFLNAYLRLAGSRVPADHRLRALVAKLAGMTSTEAAGR